MLYKQLQLQPLLHKISPSFFPFLLPGGQLAEDGGKEAPDLDIPEKPVMGAVRLKVIHLYIQRTGGVSEDNIEG